MNCHDCGEPAEKGRILQAVDGKPGGYCKTHGELRWDLVGPRPDGWLRAGVLPFYYTGPLPAQSNG
jgi:hypothetical protein